MLGIRSRVNKQEQGKNYSEMRFTLLFDPSTVACDAIEQNCKT